MPVPKPKPIEAGDGSYAGHVLASFDALRTRPKVRQTVCLDQAKSFEGLRLAFAKAEEEARAGVVSYEGANLTSLDIFDMCTWLLDAIDRKDCRSAADMTLRASILSFLEEKHEGIRANG